MLEGARDRPDAFGEEDETLDVRLGSAEQSNTSLVFGNRWILKLFRRLEDGVNLDREVGRFLTERGFEHTPLVAGAVTYRRKRSGSGNGPGNGGAVDATAAVVQRFVPNEGDAWEWTLDALGRFFESALASQRDADPLPRPGGSLLESTEGSVPEEVEDALDIAVVDAMRLLGRRTGELHNALAGGSERDFQPEPFGTLYQRSLYQSMRNLVGQTVRALHSRLREIDEEPGSAARIVLERRGDILDRFRAILDRKLDGQRLRVHGDYHLGQVLWTGRDFVIIDFEGEPARPLSERRLKRSPLRDVAGMLRSIHYASVVGLSLQREQGLGPSEVEALEPWADLWHRWMSVIFLQGYLEAADDAPFLPAARNDRQLLLDVYLLEKALYELGYELSNRPAWADVPLRGILELLDGRRGEEEPTPGEGPTKADGERAKDEAKEAAAKRSTEEAAEGSTGEAAGRTTGGAAESPADGEGGRR